MEDTNIKGMKDDNNISHNAASEISDSTEDKKTRKGYTGLIILGIITILMAGGAAWLAYQLADKQKQNEELLELAELDKQEMSVETGKMLKFILNDMLKVLARYDIKMQ